MNWQRTARYRKGKARLLDGLTGRPATDWQPVPFTLRMQPTSTTVDSHTVVEWEVLHDTTDPLVEWASARGTTVAISSLYGVGEPFFPLRPGAVLQLNPGGSL